MPDGAIFKALAAGALVAIATMFQPVGAKAGATPPPTVSEAGQVEITFWTSVKDSNDAALLQAYVDRYPTGEFVPLARIKIERLRPKKAEPVPTLTTPSPDTVAVAADGQRHTMPLKLGARTDASGARVAYLGVKVMDFPANAGDAFGLAPAAAALITKVVPGEVAETARIALGDILLRVDGRRVTSARSILEIVLALKPEADVDVEVWRIGDGADDFRTQLLARANGGDAGAAHLAGQLSSMGEILPDDKVEAVSWYRKAAEAGLAAAQTQLAFAYANGFGITKDDAEAARWMRRSAEAGDTTAMENLGIFYEQGRGVAQDSGEALHWYRKSADGGSMSAMNAVGVVYALGRGVPKDEAEAARWYRKSAEAGNPPAMYNLAIAYANGIGLGKEDVTAAQWFYKAAEAGTVPAMNMYATVLAEGRGVAKDDASAVRWWQAGVSQRDRNSMWGLATMYEAGRGVAKNSDEAARLVFESISLGYPFAIEQMTNNMGIWSSAFRTALQVRLRDAGLYSGAIDGKERKSFKQGIAELGKRATTAPPKP